MNKQDVLYAVQVKIILPVWGQKHGIEPEKYEPLVKKYGKEQAEHLDCFFLRTTNPVTKKEEVLIPGSTVYGAIKVALKKEGKPMEYPWIYGIFVDESRVIIETQKRTMPNNKPTVFCGELILPNTDAVLLISDMPNENDRPRFISLGKMKKYGYGLAEILWDTATKIKVEINTKK